MAAGRHLGFDITRHSAIRSIDHENSTLEPNMKCIGSFVAEIWPFAYHWGMWDSHFDWRGGRRGQWWMVPFERAAWFRISSPLSTVALSVTVRPQFAIVECLQRSNQQGVGHFGPKFRGVSLSSCSQWSRSIGSAENERPTLTNREIIFEEFHMWLQSTNVTDRRTDDMRSKDRALHYIASRGKNVWGRLS